MITHNREVMTLPEALIKLLDKGIVINADIVVSVAGTELLGIKIRATLASLATAAKYGLEFPSGVNYDAPGWKALREQGDLTYCPTCGELIGKRFFEGHGCPKCKKRVAVMA
ncbi:MAG: gas vesicle protein [Candidatus Aenigmarchaeota archaeon]|nr:gas vesicle protein [Candidatus Aenigmarchaeota archaeon]